MYTTRLFQQDVYQKEAEVRVSDILTRDGRIFLEFDQTVFFPVGGGQSCDTGTAGELHVVDVFEEDGRILHRIEEKECKLAIGDNVHIAIDWARRFDNMQRHCGEHILSGKFYELYGGVNRGFHMGEEYMTIDISLEADPAFDKISWEMAKEAELRTNQAIWADLPVITRHFDSREEAENLPLRKALAFDEDITIVCVGAVENPADCVACCGTHPATAGQVGMVKIYKVESNKGMFRIYFEAGQRAFRQYQSRYDTLTQLENRLSAGFSDLIPKYEAQQEKAAAVRDELYHLKKWVAAKETEDVKALLSPGFVREYDKLSINDMLEIGKGLAGNIPDVAFLLHTPSNTVLLFTDAYDAGKFVKDCAPLCGGKGGGNKNSARAIFAEAEQMDAFIRSVKERLQ